MRTQALCTSLSFKRLSLATAIVAGALGSVAHASPFSAYAGATIGLAPNPQNCENQQVCDRVSGGGKTFIGWNVTPNVAAEINYFYFGAASAASVAPVSTKVRTSARAVTLNMNWNIEMFETLTSHVRLGVARVSNRKDTITVVSSTVSRITNEEDLTTSPYVGLGLSFPFNKHLRLTTGYDFISVSGHGNRSRHLLSGGFQAEF
jgi:hypothetical protein